MSGLLKPLLKTARTATRIVAASNADAKSKARADYEVNVLYVEV